MIILVRIMRKINFAIIFCSTNNTRYPIYDHLLLCLCQKRRKYGFRLVSESHSRFRDYLCLSHIFPISKFFYDAGWTLLLGVFLNCLFYSLLIERLIWAVRYIVRHRSVALTENFRANSGSNRYQAAEEIPLK